MPMETGIGSFHQARAVRLPTFKWRVFLIYAYGNDKGSHFQVDVMFALIDVERGQSPTFQTAAMVRQAGARINVLMGNYANVLGKA